MIGVSMVEFPDINEERNVITALQSGDAEAAGILYEWFGVTLYRQVILSRLPVEHQAEDVLRDTFRIAFERIAQMINDSLELINPRYATALRLRLLEDLSRQECAARLDVSVSTFDVLFHRACKAFREHYPP